MNAGSASLHGLIREKGWTQGSIWDAEEAATPASDALLNSVALGDASRFLVVSQPCDLVCPNFTHIGEPYVMLLPLSPEPTPDGNLRNLKNPRRLQLEVSHRALGAVLHEANVHELSKAAREHLAGLHPSAEWSISKENLRLVTDWLARRFTRSALPDAFNEGLARMEKRIRSQLLKVVEDVDQVYIRLNPEGEPTAEEPLYAVELIVAVRQIDGMERARAASSQLVDLLKTAVPIIDTRAVESRVEFLDRLSLSDVNEYKIWDFERLSHGQDG